MYTCVCVEVWNTEGHTEYWFLCLILMYHRSHADGILYSIDETFYQISPKFTEISDIKQPQIKNAPSIQGVSHKY